MFTTLRASKARARASLSSAATIIGAALALFVPAVDAAIIQQTPWRLNGTDVDFGSGIHANGVPAGSGSVSWDFTFNSTTDQLVATAHVTGTLYQTASGLGCIRMTIQFRRGTTVLHTRTIGGCSIGGDPNLAANQRQVDESFSSPLVDNVVMTTTSVNPFTGAALGGGASGTDTCASVWVRDTRVNNGLADFGTGNHSNGRPDGLGRMRMQRLFGPGVASRIAGSVTGTLYYDSLTFQAGPQSVIEVLYMNADGDVIGDDSDFVAGTGINANFSWNQTSVNETFTDGDLFGIRIRVFVISLGEASPAVERDLVISSQSAGTFDLAPATWQGTPREIVPFAFSWTVPPGKNWHDLESVRLRIRDGQDSVFSIVFHEATGDLALVNDANGHTGPFFPVGSNHRLQTSHVRLHLSESSIVASGPTSPTVTVNLALEFKPRAAGRSYIIEVGAVDDEGNEDPFTAAGSVIVEE